MTSALPVVTNPIKSWTESPFTDSNSMPANCPLPSRTALLRLPHTRYSLPAVPPSSIPQDPGTPHTRRRTKYPRPAPDDGGAMEVVAQYQRQGTCGG